MFYEINESSHVCETCKWVRNEESWNDVSSNRVSLKGHIVCTCDFFLLSTYWIWAFDHWWKKVNEENALNSWCLFFYFKGFCWL